ncbi:unnamed protein product [Protopolystoma xenopodis]|uniref:Uncharacterized protein n=1 Tax=Protopolystoma xenopodis TaxID=117903 RepID=A0A448XDL1_9PLAT|nr:unnamed protein product [Protopolystoma xenopodis]
MVTSLAPFSPRAHSGAGSTSNIWTRKCDKMQFQAPVRIAKIGNQLWTQKYDRNSRFFWKHREGTAVCQVGNLTSPSPLKVRLTRPDCRCFLWKRRDCFFQKFTTANPVNSCQDAKLCASYSNDVGRLEVKHTNDLRLALSVLPAGQQLDCRGARSCESVLLDSVARCIGYWVADTGYRVACGVWRVACGVRRRGQKGRRMGSRMRVSRTPGDCGRGE